MRTPKSRKANSKTIPEPEKQFDPRILYEEIIRRFPDAASHVHESDAGLPYVVLGDFVFWLKSLAEAHWTPILIRDVVAFAHWCEDQPRGKDSGNDMLTIYTVAFFEHLFDSEKTRRLIPRLVSREELITNEAYLITWVGSENYSLALNEFPPETKKKPPRQKHPRRGSRK